MTPLSRYLATFFTFLLVVVVDIYYGKHLFDPNSIYPFLILMAIPASLCVFFGWEALVIVRKACIPIGIIVCTMNVVLFVNGSSNLSETINQQRLFYSPLALGIITSYVLSIIEKDKPIVMQHSRKIIFFILLANSLVVWMAAKFMLLNNSDEGLSIFAFNDWRPICAFLVILCLSSTHPRTATLPLFARLYKSSLLLVLLSVIYGISTYVSQSLDLSRLGPAVIDANSGIMTGSFLALVSICLGGSQSQSTQESMFFDWHLIEAYAFYVLIIMPPLSIIEVVGINH